MCPRKSAPNSTEPVVLKYWKVQIFQFDGSKTLTIQEILFSTLAVKWKIASGRRICFQA